MNDRPSIWIRMYREVETWCTGRVWYGRAVLVGVFVWMGYHHLVDDRYWGLFGYLNLGIHELGHMVFRPLGWFMYVLGGTLGQLLVPVISVFMFRRQRDYFALTLSGAWLSTNLYNVATYMADARARVLPLVTPFGKHAEHDWYKLFGHMGLLAYDTKIAAGVRVIAFVLMWGSVAAGAWMCYLMATRRKAADG